MKARRGAGGGCGHGSPDNVAAREPQRAKLILSRYGLLARLTVDYAEPDWESLPLLARRWEISAYDAAYLQLALASKAPLVTLDSRLAKAYDRAAANA